VSLHYTVVYHFAGACCEVSGCRIYSRQPPCLHICELILNWNRTRTALLIMSSLETLICQMQPTEISYNEGNVVNVHCPSPRIFNSITNSFTYLCSPCTSVGKMGFKKLTFYMKNEQCDKCVIQSNTPLVMSFC
jgi:hypothetical protein